MRITRDLLALFLLSSSAQSADLVIGVESTDQFPIYSGAGSTYRGFARELLDDFAKQNGHSVRYKILPIMELYEQWLLGKVDLKFPDNPKWQPSRRLDIQISYSQPVLIVTEGISVRPHAKGRPLSALKAIATLRGFTPWPYMDEVQAKRLRIYEKKDFMSAISMATNGQVGGLYANSTAVNYYLIEKLKKPGLLVFDNTLPNDRAEFHLSSIKHPELITQFDTYLRTHHATVARLKSKYHILD